jgi:hypothetical protein
MRQQHRDRTDPYEWSKSFYTYGTLSLETANKPKTEGEADIYNIL